MPDLVEPIHIHLSIPPKRDMFDLLQRSLDSRFCISTGAQIAHPDSINFLVSGHPTQHEIENCPNLRAVIIPFAGIPSSTSDLMREYPHISVHNLHHNTVPVVENTLALLLAACKHIIPPHCALRHNDWRPRYAPNPSILLTGKTALLLGYGQIGSRLAKVLQPLGMHILAIRNTIKMPQKDPFAIVYPADALHTLLPQTHILINTLPLTPQTEGLIGEKELALLPQGAVLVNVGRAQVINQHAFYNALKYGHLGAAAIDVWYRYPEDEESHSNTAPADFPFGEQEQVVLSPHRAGGLNSSATEQLRMEHLSDLLNYAARSEPLPNRVDLERGY